MSRIQIMYDEFYYVALNNFQGKQNLVDHVKAICTKEGMWKMEFSSTCKNATHVLDVVSKMQ